MDFYRMEGHYKNEIRKWENKYNIMKDNYEKNMKFE